jgi:hypothetical protein
MPTEIENLIDRLKKHCEKRGAARRLAQTLGIHETLIGHYIRGDYLPRIELFFRIKQYLDANEPKAIGRPSRRLSDSDSSGVSDSGQDKVSRKG